MQWKWEEKTKDNLLEVISSATGIDIEEFDKKMLLEGAREKDIVYAGLDEVMSSVKQEVSRLHLAGRWT